LIPTIIKQNVDAIISNELETLKRFDNKTVLVTGSTGMIGSFLVYVLAEYAKQKNSATKIIANARSKAKAEAMFAQYMNDESFELLICDLDQINTEKDIDYIIHAASPTQPKDFLNKPVDIIDANTFITKKLLGFCKDKQAVFCLLSTLEIYGEIKAESYPVVVNEDDFGALDSTDLRSTYPESKRLAESMCVAYSSQFNVASTIVRLGPVVSPVIDEHDERVYAQFVKRVFDNEDITLFSDAADKKRSYTYVCDAVSGILIALGQQQPERCSIYNLANNENIISIQEMAEKIIAQNPSASKLKIVQREDSSNTSSSTGKIVLGSEKLINLGWKPNYSFDDCVLNTFQYLRQAKNVR